MIRVLLLSLACQSPPQTVVIEKPAAPNAPAKPVANERPMNQFYKYKDAHGTWGYADTLDAVPLKYRASAVPMNLPAARPGEDTPPAAPTPPPAAGQPGAPPPLSPTAQPAAETAPAPLPKDAKKDAAHDARKDGKDSIKEQETEAKKLLERAKALEAQAVERAKSLNE